MEPAVLPNKVWYSTDARDFGQVAKSIPCQNACPARTNIPGYIRLIYEKRYSRAYELNRGANILPGVLGRICSRPCETACRHGEPGNGRSVGICHLKRACADLKSPMHRIAESLYGPSGKRVAVIGAGPAGLACAHDLAVFGHEVVIFESREKPGGMLMYGIPEFRLPRDLLMTEISNILRLGIALKTSQKVGTDVSLEDLQKDFHAVVVSTGCTRPVKLGVPGEDLEHVYDGLKFMDLVNAGEKPFVGRTVAVIGAGFTAVDCARSALRLGAEHVTLNIRKTQEQMRIDETEKHEALFEGIRIQALVQPSKILGENGKVTAIEFRHTRMETRKGADGRPPVKTSRPIDGSEFIIPCDSVIAALGQSPDGEQVAVDPGEINPGTHRVGGDNLFVAGDFSTGSTDVITAIAGGRQCALSVDAFFMGIKRREWKIRLESHTTTDRPRAFDFIERIPVSTLDMEQRMASYTREVETGFSPDHAHEESKRCYLCNLRYEIDPLRCIYCSACIDVAPKDCIKMVTGIPVTPEGAYGDYQETRQWNRVVSITIDNDQCIRCGQCYAVCPMDCISVTKTELVRTDL